MANQGSVVAAFLEGKKLKAGNFSTDGSNVFSYRLPIANMIGGWVYLLNGPGRPFSQTTKCHIAAVRNNIRSRGVTEVDVLP